MHTNTTPKLIVILGPTASGKTELSLQLARKFSGYIISADSRQIYQGMDIGTGKLSGGVWQKNQTFGRVLHFHNIPHFMIDIVRPDQEFTVSQFQKNVNQIIRKNLPQIPLLVGGTGLYIAAIVDGLAIPRIAPDPKLRCKLEKKSAQALYRQLKKMDPETAQKIDRKNRRRLIRALEVCLKTGKTFSQFQKKRKPNHDVLLIGLTLPRAELHKRIDQRVDKMIAQGLVAETRQLCRGLIHQTQIGGVINHAPTDTIWNFPAMSGLGYKQIGMYLRGEISLEQAIDLIKLRTRQFAKRQMTWFKRDPRIHWVKNTPEAIKLTKNFLGK